MLSNVLSEEKTKLELYSVALGHNNHTLDFVSESYGGAKQASGGARVAAEKMDDTGITSLWDLVKKETVTSVNSQRVKYAFVDSQDNKETDREFASHKEMLEAYRDTGNELGLQRRKSLRFRSKSARGLRFRSKSARGL